MLFWKLSFKLVNTVNVSVCDVIKAFIKAGFQAVVQTLVQAVFQ